MNDFTKEELIEILEYCNWQPPGLGFSDFRVNLWKKIDSMIDKKNVQENCKHNWEFVVNHYDRLKCENCEMVCHE